MNNHRDLLCNLLDEATGTRERTESTEAMHKSLSKSCSSFATWRWQTLQTVTRDLLLMCAALRTALDPPGVTANRLGTRDGPKAAQVLDTVRSKDFWTRTEQLSYCAKPLHELSSWLRGCACHEAQRPRRGVVVRCPWAGCRAPELADKLRSVKRDLLERLQGGILDQGTEALSLILCLFGLKFDWVFDLPFVVWRVRDAATARAFLDRYAKQVEDGIPVHRVTRYFADPAFPGSLRSEMEHLANTQHCLPRLQAELLAYQACPLDETVIEAVHRDVSCIAARRGTYQSLPFAAATLRIDQNYAELDRWGDTFKRSVLHWMKHPSAIRAAGPRRRPRDRRRGHHGFGSFRDSVAPWVYRMDATKFVHWGVFERKMAGMTKTLSRCERVAGTTTARQALLADFLRPLLQKGCIFSLPSVLASAVQALREIERLPSEDLTRTLDSAHQGPFTLFQVLDPGVSKKKLPPSERQRDLRRMGMPVAIQRFSITILDDENGDPQLPEPYPAESYLAYPTDSTEVVDATTDLADWCVLRHALRKWTLSQEGCVSRLTSSNAVTLRPQDIHSGADIPVLVCIELLLNAGWQFGQSPLLHTVDTPREFQVGSSPVSQKRYLRCLLLLPEVLSLENFKEGLPSGALQSTYTDILKRLTGAGPDTDAEGCSSATEIEVDTAPDVLDAAICPKRVAEGDTAQAPLVKRPRQASAAATAATSALDELLWHVEPLAPLAETSAAGSSTDVRPTKPMPPPPPPNRLRGAKVDAQKHKEATMEGRLLHESLEDQAVFLDDKPYYCRTKVDCPIHENCRKWRGIGTAQTTPYGPKQPYGFLGAWLQSAQNHTDRSHIYADPDLPATRAYMQARGWLLEHQA